MQIRIVHAGSDLLTTNVENDTTVNRVKEVIAQNIKVQPRDQVLTFKGLYLEDTNRLGDYGVQEYGSLELHLRLNSRKVIPVRVAFSPTAVVSIPVRQDATVGQLRQEAIKRAEEGDHAIDAATASLIYSHYVMEDRRRLEEYGIGANACITVACVLEREATSPVDTAEPYDYCDDFQRVSLDGGGGSGGGGRPGSPDPPELPPRETYQAISHPKIKVHFLADDSNPFTLSIPLNAPLKTVCNEVLSMTGIPIESQEYVISGQSVDAEQMIQDLGIAEGDSVFLKDSRVLYPSRGADRNLPSTSYSTVPQSRKSHEIKVNFDTGRYRIPMNLSRRCTIQQALQALQKHPQLSGRRIYLHLGRTYLEPNRTFADYGVSTGNTVQVYVHSDGHHRGSTGFL